MVPTNLKLISPLLCINHHRLVEHPLQDPGSEYGRQKRLCRELMFEFARDQNFDIRWAIVPGVIHDEMSWGDGTTEYALDAIRAAVQSEGSHNQSFPCPIHPDTRLPMIFMPDLIRGLLALQLAPGSHLKEPTNGYCISGFSFTARELFKYLKDRFPRFSWHHHHGLSNLKAPQGAALFADLWPNSLSGHAAKRDLGYTPQTGFALALDTIIDAHYHHERTKDTRINVDISSRI